MKPIKHTFCWLLTGLTIACSSGNDDVAPQPDQVPPPGASTLIFPDNNAECQESTVISDTESTVTFRWAASENTDSYALSLTNLDTQASQSLNTAGTELAITILRGTPYSWSVTSKANGTAQTAESAKWKFYNAGAPIENHVPFPAEASNPRIGSSIDAGTVTLQWQGSDVDNDIVSYDIFMDTVDPPSAPVGNSTSNTMQVEVISGQIYYWKVVTNDNAGNTSGSEIFQFKVN